mmetsp:Transcript_8062/g.9290  ORF Transcript_8062/g.9290 Transcript_8062/m.9290 type:complete len:80 (+) Transcript_8062:51-290(+)
MILPPTIEEVVAKSSRASSSSSRRTAVPMSSRMMIRWYVLSELALRTNEKMKYPWDIRYAVRMNHAPIRRRILILDTGT